MYLVPLSAVLLVIATRIPSLCWLALFCFVPALIAFDRKPLSRWFWGSALLFFCVAAGVNYWVYHVSHHFGGLPSFAALLLVPIFSFLNLWQGCIGFSLFRWLQPRLRIPKALLFSLCFAAAWHWIPTIFIWDFAILVRPWHWLIQGVDLFGAIGIDFVLAFTNYAVFQAWRSRRFVPALRIACVLLVALNLYGFYRTTTLSRTLASAPKIRVALIQPNLNSGAKADRRFVGDSIRRLTNLSNNAARQDAQLIVWPESVFPIDYHRDKGLQRLLRDATTRWNAPLLFGGSEFEPRQPSGWRAFNGAMLIAPGATQIQTYRKNILLAFGEYIPFEDTLPLIRKWMPTRVGQFGRGPGPTQFTAGSFSLAPVICYESIISDYIRRSALLPVDFIVELTNDGWYGKTIALTYHKDITALRAIENRIGLARDTNTGVTTFIDPVGHEHGTLPLETAGMAMVDIPMVRPYSPFTHFGYLAKPVLGLLCLGMILVALLGHPPWRHRQYLDG